MIIHYEVVGEAIQFFAHIDRELPVLVVTGQKWDQSQMAYFGGTAEYHGQLYKIPDHWRSVRAAFVLIEDLCLDRPTDRLAVLCGVQDAGYHTPSCGWIPSYSGEAIVKMLDGSIWRCYGSPPQSTGPSPYNYRNGCIEYSRVTLTQPHFCQSCPHAGEDKCCGGAV